MMRLAIFRVLMLSLVLVSFRSVHAFPDEVTTATLTPIAAMQKVEMLQTGIICDFKLTENNRGKADYYINTIDPHQQTLHQYYYNGSNRQLLLEGSQALSSYDVEKLNAVLFLRTNRLSFSNMVRRAIANNRGALVHAELEHDLGTNYLSVDLVDAKGKYVIAYDIDNKQHMPVLKRH